MDLRSVKPRVSLLCHSTCHTTSHTPTLQSSMQTDTRCLPPRCLWVIARQFIMHEEQDVGRVRC